VRAEKITLRRAPRGKSSASTDSDRQFWAVWVNEINPPEEFEAVRWLLLTNEELSPDKKQKAFMVIDWYRQRWGIETFHKILKSGCRVEAAEFQAIERLKIFILLKSLIAWRLHALIHIQREHPDTACTEVLSGDEWQVLYKKIHKTNNLPAEPPSIRQATLWVARLGGFLGRKGDGEPGAMILWRGWQRLMDMAEGYSASHSYTAPQRYG